MKKKRTSHVLAYYDSAKADLAKEDLVKETGDEGLADELVSLMKADGLFDTVINLIDGKEVSG